MLDYVRDVSISIHKACFSFHRKRDRYTFDVTHYNSKGFYTLEREKRYDCLNDLIEELYRLKEDKQSLPQRPFNLVRIYGGSF